MIWRIFLAAFLFEIISAPIICAIASWIIGSWCDRRIKAAGSVLKIVGEEMKKYSLIKKKEGNDNGEP